MNRDKLSGCYNQVGGEFIPMNKVNREVPPEELNNVGVRACPDCKILSISYFNNTIFLVWTKSPEIILYIYRPEDKLAPA